MEGFIIIGGLIILLLVAASILSFVNQSRISGLTADILKLKDLVAYQATQIAKLAQIIENLKANSISQASAEPQADDSAEIASKAAAHFSAYSRQLDETSENRPKISTQLSTISKNEPLRDNATPDPQTSQRDLGSKGTTPLAAFSIESFLLGNGLLWLGAVVLALGGLFLAKYSIETDMLAPSVRVISGAIFGLLLVMVAEFLYRNPKKFQINTPLISAALASGGVITCFAMTFVAYDFYAFLSPLLAFILFAAISVATTWLSLRFGPLLALIGVIGAYLVPELVSTATSDVFTLLVYVGFISVTVVWVHALIKHAWLWYLGLIGHFGWLFLVIETAGLDEQWLILGNVVVAIYLFIFVSTLGWKCNQTSFEVLSIKRIIMPRKEQLGIILSVLAVIYLYVDVAFQHNILIVLAILSAILLLAPFRHSAFDSWPYIALVLCLLTFLKMPVNYDYNDKLFAFGGGYLFVQVSALGFLAYCWIAAKLLPVRPSFLLLLVVAPLSLMGLGYALSDVTAIDYLYPVWSIELMLIAIVFAIMGVQTRNLLHKMSFIMLANGALTLTFTMLLSASTLSLAIVMQITLMTYLSQQYRLPLPSCLYKVAISVVLLRLTLAPWLADYTNETILNLHWSLVIYPLVFAFLYLAYRFQQESALKAWFIGAMLHVLALFITTESSYLIQGEYPNLFKLTFTQSILLSVNYLALGAVYLWRRQSSRLTKLYTVYASILLTGAGALQIYLSVLHNPYWVQQYTGDNILFNWLFPLWAMPALILSAMLDWHLVKAKLKQAVRLIASVFSVFYINGIIRGYYHDGLLLIDEPMNQQEVYVYSIVWLMVAIGLIVAAQKLKNSVINKLGFAVLAIVVLKTFLIDLSNLAGLYRAVSFIGLGLSLVALGWLFQRFSDKAEDAAAIM